MKYFPPNNPPENYIGIIYMATNLLNNKKYIGQTTRSLKVRVKRHIREVKRTSSHFHNAIIKYGEGSFRWEIIGYVSGTHSDLNIAEKECIYFFRTYGNNGIDFDTVYGYNMTYGGQESGGLIGELNPNYGNTWTAEQKKKQSTKMSGRYKGKNNPNYGNTWTEEQKKRQSEKMKGRYKGKNNPMHGRKRTQEEKKKMKEIKRKRFLEKIDRDRKKVKQIYHRHLDRKTNIINMKSNGLTYTVIGEFFNLERHTVSKIYNGENK